MTGERDRDREKRQRHRESQRERERDCDKQKWKWKPLMLRKCPPRDAVIVADGRQVVLC